MIIICSTALDSELLVALVDISYRMGVHVGFSFQFAMIKDLCCLIHEAHSQASATTGIEWGWGPSWGLTEEVMLDTAKP